LLRLGKLSLRSGHALTIAFGFECLRSTIPVGFKRGNALLVGALDPCPLKRELLASALGSPCPALPPY